MYKTYKLEEENVALTGSLHGVVIEAKINWITRQFLLIFHLKKMSIIFPYSLDLELVLLNHIIFKRRPDMADKSNSSYAGQNSHRGAALPPNNHGGGNWPSTTGKTSGSGRGNAAPKGGQK